ncbi:hypothetical protein [Nitrosopumilus piranensis]|uniref:hypothetical protein n=1 Tax=Nitrosopumilus piranensis TaxID=1582439 RepID=UPI00136265EA|nr:hypothetical protein [Nitrosopumilus piranensis]
MTNRLTEADFGIWQVIQTTQGYTIFLIPIVSYWTVRYFSRGTNVGRTSAIGSLIVAIPATGIYFIATSFFIGTLDVSIFYFLLGWFQIPLSFMIGSLESTTQGTKPQRMSYAFIISEVAKIIFAVPLLVVLDQGLDVIITIVIATQIVQMLMLVMYNRDYLKEEFNYQIMKHWLKISWMPILTAVPGLIYTFDVAIVTYITKSTEVIAFYKAAFLIANLITYAQFLGIALYPKIMKGGTSEDIESILKLLLMFLIPLAIGTYFLSEHLLFLLKNSYLESFMALQILIPSSIVIVFYLFFDNILTGTVHTEIEKNVSFKKLFKSRLFLVSKIGISWSVAYLILLYLLLFFISPNIDDYSSISAIWAIATLISLLPFTIYKGIISRRILYFHIPWNSLGKFALSSIAMIISLLIIMPLIDFGVSKITFAFFIGGEIIVATGVYFIILYTIDKEFRSMIKSAKKAITE